MFVQNASPSAKAERPKKAIPREWGIKKEHYENGERCQVKWHRKWYIAKVVERVPGDSGGDIRYRVCFLFNDEEDVVSASDIRTFVPPLPSQLRIGMRVRAMWSKDGRFYNAVIEEDCGGGEFGIRFEKYNEFGTVSLYDIQLLPTKDSKEGLNAVKKKKDGTLVIADSATIPQALWSRDDDTPTEREKKRKKIRSIKRQHRSLKIDVESKNRAHSWTQFKKKSLKKSKKKLKSTLLSSKEQRRSIFENPSNQTASTLMENNQNMTTFTKRTHFHHLKRDPKHYKNSSGGAGGHGN